MTLISNNDHASRPLTLSLGGSAAGLSLFDLLTEYHRKLLTLAMKE